jgi:hypothetical protein
MIAFMMIIVIILNVHILNDAILGVFIMAWLMQGTLSEGEGLVQLTSLH